MAVRLFKGTIYNQAPLAQLDRASVYGIYFAPPHRPTKTREKPTKQAVFALSVPLSETSF